MCNVARRTSQVLTSTSLVDAVGEKSKAREVDLFSPRLRAGLVVFKDPWLTQSGAVLSFFLGFLEQSAQPRPKVARLHREWSCLFGELELLCSCLHDLMVDLGFIGEAVFGFGKREFG